MVERSKIYDNEVIRVLCGLYSSEKYIEANSLIVETLCKGEDLHGMALWECMEYAQEKYHNDKVARPMFELSWAFEDWENFVDNIDRNPKNVSGLMIQMVKVKQYMTPSEKRKIDNKLLKLKDWMKKNTQSLDDEKKPESRKLTENEKEFKDRVRIYKYHKLSVQQKEGYAPKVKMAALMLYQELEAKIINPLTDYKEKVHCFGEIVSTVGWLDLNKTDKFKKKAKIYQSLANLHRQHNDNKAADVADQEADRFVRAKVAIVQHTSSKYVKEFER